VFGICGVYRDFYSCHLLVAWLFYRPLLGITLLLVSGGLSYFVYKRAKENQASPNVVHSTGERYEMVKGRVASEDMLDV
jgi:hypothetical protein